MLAEQRGDSPDGRQWGFLISQEATRQEELTGFAVISFDFETGYVHASKVDQQNVGFGFGAHIALKICPFLVEMVLKKLC